MCRFHSTPLPFGPRACAGPRCFLLPFAAATSYHAARAPEQPIGRVDDGRKRGGNSMQSVLMTGASGGIGTRLRTLLKGVYPRLRLSDLKPPADLKADEEFVAADLADMAAVEKAVAGIEGIIHLGGFSVEGPWDVIHSANIVGCYNLFEAARRAKVKRVVFA